MRFDLTAKVPRLVIHSALMLGLAAPVHAQKLFDQTDAINGGVTPDDLAGFPVTLSEPGSYRLTGNLTVPTADTTAISITADDVTLDLNGFAIIGPAVCATRGNCYPQAIGPGGNGVQSSSQTNITVRNGTVRGMGGSGIYLPFEDEP